MRAKWIKTPNECIKLAELNKVVRKTIRSDITQYEEEKIIEERGNNLCIKKALKAINHCRFLLPKINNLESKYEYNRKNFVEVATKFYRENTQTWYQEISPKKNAINGKRYAGVMHAYCHSYKRK